MALLVSLGFPEHANASHTLRALSRAACQLYAWAQHPPPPPAVVLQMGAERSLNTPCGAQRMEHCQKEEQEEEGKANLLGFYTLDCLKILAV